MHGERERGSFQIKYVSVGELNAWKTPSGAAKPRGVPRDRLTCSVCRRKLSTYLWEQNKVFHKFITTSVRKLLKTNIYIYIHTCVCACVFACVRVCLFVRQITSWICVFIPTFGPAHWTSLSSQKWIRHNIQPRLYQEKKTMCFNFFCFSVKQYIWIFMDNKMIF